MSNFKIGQEIVCIYPTDSLILNKSYFINRICSCSCGGSGIELKGVQRKESIGSRCRCGEVHIGKHNLFGHWRFRPLDHAFADEVIKMICEEPEIVEV